MRRKKGNRIAGPVWTFVDLFLLLCAAFLMTSEVSKKESNDTNQHRSPKIFLFLEERNPGKYAIKCNGRDINKTELQKIIKLSLKKKVHHVEVKAKVEKQIPTGYTHMVKRIAESAGVVNENGKRVLKVQWDSDDLTSHSLAQAKSN